MLWHKEGLENDSLPIILPSPTPKGTEMKIMTEFTIKLAKERALEEIIKASDYAEVNFLVKEGIQKKRLSMRNEVPGEHRIILLGIDDGISSQEVLTETRRIRLDRPTHGDAFLFGEQHPDEQNSGPIVFLHELQYSWSGYSFNLLLDTSRRGRIISLISSGGWWHSGFRFAFRGR